VLTAVLHVYLCALSLSLQLKSGYAAPVTNEDGTEGSAQIDEVAALVGKFFTRTFFRQYIFPLGSCLRC
jgi:hypothetical protein